MKRLLLVLCLLSVGASVEAAVAFDANATADCTANSVNLVTGKTCATLTVGTGANRAVVCQVGLSLHSPATEVMTWDLGGANQLMTLIRGADNTGTNGRAELWGLVAPTSGAKTVQYTAVGTSDITINCVSWTGVDQTGGATSFPNAASATGTSATASVTITSAVGNATMDSTANDGSQYNSATKTITYNDATPNLISAAGSRAGGAATVTHQWTLNVSANWVSVGTDLLAAAGGGCTVAPTLTLLGVGNCGG